MNPLLRKCRGVLSFGLMWGAVWAAIFLALVFAIGLIKPGTTDDVGLLKVAWTGGVFGFVSGAIFAVFLALMDGRKILKSLSPLRAAIWGILGTAAFPLLTVVDDRMVFILCPIGAALAAGSVAIAKRAELKAAPSQRELTS